MIKFATNILFATDFSDSSTSAFRYSLEWAKALDASLTLVNVQSLQPGLDIDASVSQRFYDEQREAAKAQLDLLLTEARRQVSTATAQHLTGMPSEQISQLAKDKNFDLIIVGTHGWSGIDRVLFGSVAERVIAGAPCPVFSVPLRKPEEVANMHVLQVAPRQIVLPLDFSDCSMDAYEYAVQIAKWFDSAITLVYAIEPLSYSLDFTLTHPLQDRSNRKKIQDRLVELTEVLTKQGMTAEFELQDHPAMEAILEASITRQADLIVMGTHGRKGLTRMVMGSITTKVLQNSPYPVLTVKSPKFEGVIVRQPSPNARPPLKDDTGLLTMTEPRDPALDREEEGLHRLLDRLSEQSRRVDFLPQRQMALGLVLQPYLDPLTARFLTPLEEEIQLAEWYLYADFFPTDGHPSLVEQIRDTISDHVPEEERRWLDPVRHSYMDVLSILDIDQSAHPCRLELQSLGDGQRFQVPDRGAPTLQKNRVLLTRLIRGPSFAFLPGPPLILSAAMGKTLLSCTHDLRRQIEFDTGNFALAEWPEFMKAYGYLLVWSLAKIRGGTMILADSQVTYWNESGEPFLYAIALYEHHEFHSMASRLDSWEHLDSEAGKSPPGSGPSGQAGIRVWVAQAPESSPPSRAVARLTLTPTQLFVEADSASRLDSLKHQLAAEFGFSLHFRGETLTPPPHSPPKVDLLAEEYLVPPVTVSREHECGLLSEFLEKVYLEWAEQPCPALHNETPRHYGRNPEHAKEVAGLIAQMEHHDLGLRRTGQPAYNYKVLRDHLGL